MEKFEEYRKNLAEEIKETPKEERKTKLELEKNNPDYDKAKELHQAKRGVYELIHTEDLENPEDPSDVTYWIKTEIEDYADRRDAFLMGYMFEDVFGQITKYLAQRLKVNPKKVEDLNLADYWSKHIPDEYDGEGTTQGSVSFMGRTIFEYSSFGDGYGFSLTEWSDGNLSESTSDLIKLLKEKAE